MGLFNRTFGFKEIKKQIIESPNSIQWNTLAIDSAFMIKE